MRKIPNEILMPVLAYYEDFAKTNGRVNEVQPMEKRILIRRMANLLRQLNDTQKSLEPLSF